MVFGKSISIDFAIDDEEALMSLPYMEGFMRNLVKALGMKIHQINGYDVLEIDRWGAEHDPDTYGVSCVCLITTSSITFHTTQKIGDKLPHLYLDVFSCKTDFTAEKLYDIVSDHFSHPKIVNSTTTTRH